MLPHSLLDVDSEASRGQKNEGQHTIVCLDNNLLFWLLPGMLGVFPRLSKLWVTGIKDKDQTA